MNRELRIKQNDENLGLQSNYCKFKTSPDKLSLFSYDSATKKGFSDKRRQRDNLHSKVLFEDEETRTTLLDNAKSILSKKTVDVLTKAANRKRNRESALNKKSQDISTQYTVTNEKESKLPIEHIYFEEESIERLVRTLPNELGDLFYQMREYDSAINLMKIRKKSSFFSDLKELVQKALRVSTSLADFGRIMTVCSSLYKCNWAKDERTQRHDLVIEITGVMEDRATNLPYFSNKLLQDRQKIFFHALLEYLASEVKLPQKVLSKEQPKKQTGNGVESVKGFDDFFASEEEKENRVENRLSFLKKFKKMHFSIAIYNFPPNPSDILRKKKENSLIKKREETVDRQKKTGILAELMEKGLISSSKNASVSRTAKQSIMSRKQRIQELKERMYNKVKMNVEEGKVAPVQKKSSSLTDSVSRKIELVNSLYTYYTTRNVENCFYASILRYLKKNRFSDIETRELKRIIGNLLESFPNWLKLLVINGKEILRLKKSDNVETIIEGLKDN